MKIRIQMKDPDCLNNVLAEAAAASVATIAELNINEREALAEARFDVLLKQARKFFKWDEYLTVELDTDSGTCIVIPAEEP